MQCTYSMFHIHISAIKAKLNTSAVYSDNQEFRIYGIKEILNDFKNYRDMNTGNRIEVHKQTISSTTYSVLFRLFVYAIISNSLFPAMFKIFDVECQLADDFNEKVYFSTFQ